jgi:medium-chain acyl-[acyl-carrier-protein] hydrolase
MRLFCFPYAGGNSMIYRQWPELLPKNIEVCPVNLPGRGNRLHELAFTDVPSLVEAAVEPIAAQADKRFAFFGHSMGALISFELARALRRKNLPQPSYIFISGRMAPQFNDDDAPTYNLPDEQFVEEIRRLNGTPREVLENPELMHLMTPLLRADFSVCQTYQYTVEEPLDCPITAFGGLQDYEVTRESLDGWREHTKRAFRLRMVQGDHFFINSAPHVILGAIAQELYQFAEQSQTGIR